MLYYLLCKINRKHKALEQYCLVNRLRRTNIKPTLAECFEIQTYFVSLTLSEYRFESRVFILQLVNFK